MNNEELTKLVLEQKKMHLKKCKNGTKVCLSACFLTIFGR